MRIIDLTTGCWLFSSITDLRLNLLSAMSYYCHSPGRNSPKVSGVVWFGVVSEGVVRMWWHCAWSGVGVPCQCDLTTGLLITCTDQPHQGPVYPGSEVSEVPPVSATQVLLASTLLTSFLLLLAGYICCICIIITLYHKPLHYRLLLYRSEKYDFYQRILVRAYI